MLQSVGCSLEPDAQPKRPELRPSGSLEIAAFFPAEADAGMVDKGILPGGLGQSYSRRYIPKARQRQLKGPKAGSR